MASPQSMHIDAALTNYAVKSGQGAFAATRLFPVMPVLKESDVYYVYGDEHVADDTNMVRAAGTKAGRVEWSKTTGSYVAREYTLGHSIPQRLLDNADPALNPMARGVDVLKAKVLLAYERRVATQATTQANYATALKAAASGAWSSSTTAIEADMDTARNAVMKACGYEPNTLVVSSELAKVMKRNPGLRELVKYTDPSLLVNGDLPQTLFGLSVVVPGARNNSANPGQTASMGFVWPATTAVLAYVDPAASLDAMTYGLTFRVSTYGVQGERVKRWWDDETDSWVLEYGILQTEAVVSSNAAYLIHTIS